MSFIAAVAFMFASTNLVIELGILILIFLGWQFLAAEIVGGLILITISSFLIKLTYLESWLEYAREKVEGEGDEMADNCRKCADCAFCGSLYFYLFDGKHPACHRPQ